MHRRDFLKFVGLTGGAATLAATGVARAASGAGVAPNPAAIGVLHDSTLCIGCRRCEAACAEVNARPAPKAPFDDLSVLDKKRRTTVDSYTVVNKYLPGTARPVFRKQQCNHCQEPACASACFVKAFRKNADGSVAYDPSLCVGCRYCMIACPFNVPTYDYNKVLAPLVHKCTLCEPRLAQGKRPGCVDACPVDSLLFGRRLDLLQIAKDRIAKNPGRYVNHIYGESEMGGTSWLYLSPVPHEQLGQPVLGKTSVPELTAGALGSVPMVAGLWPVLLTGAYAISKRKEKVSAEEQRDAVNAAVAETEAKAAKALESALAKAGKDRDAALAKVQTEQEAALKAKEEALSELEALKAEAAKQPEKPKKAAGAKKPAAPKAKTPVSKKPAAKEEDA